MLRSEVIKGVRVEVLPSYTGRLKCRTGMIVGQSKYGCAIVLLDTYLSTQHWHWTFLKKIDEVIPVK